MHFYERIKQKFVYIYLFALARRFYRFLKNFPNVGYDILERGYRYDVFDCKIFKSFSLDCSLLLTMVISLNHFATHIIQKTNSCIDSFTFYLYRYNLFLVSICHQRY